MIAAGLVTMVDAACNLIGRRTGTTERWLASGSHLDSVVDGGWLDGAYGVVAAVEVAHALAAAGRLRHGLMVAAFANEEGARGAHGMSGSRAVVGALSSHELERSDDEGWTLGERLAAAAGDPGRVPDAHWDLASIEAFVELHIEQGPVLQSRGAALGVVTGITGRQSLDIHVVGRSNHAGTTPMDSRRDALAAAAEAVLRVEDLAREDEVRVATCGRIDARPNVRNVVPGEVSISAELRDESTSRMTAAIAHLSELLRQLSERRRVSIQLVPGQLVPPVRAAESVVNAAERAVQRSGLAWATLPSGAGHDAQILGQVVPMGMLFVPSRDGISHAPVEDTDPEHLVAGAQSLLDTIVILDEESS